MPRSRAPRTWGFWTEHKLEILSEYLRAFTTASKRAGATVYLDLFSGEAENVSRKAGEVIDGSPKRALDTRPPFTKVLLFELEDEARRLEEALRRVYPDRGFTVYSGDCNVRVDDALHDLRHLDWAPTFAFVDQYAAELHWSTLSKLAAFKRPNSTKAELWLLLAHAMLPRGLTFQAGAPDTIFARRTSALFGSDEWREIHAARVSQLLTPERVRDELTNLMRWRLEKVLGYKSTHAFEMRNVSGIPIYQMIFATDNAAGDRIMSDLYGKAAQRHEQMRQRALARRRQEREEQHGRIGLFDVPVSPAAVRDEDLYRHEPPTPPFRLRDVDDPHQTY